MTERPEVQIGATAAPMEPGVRKAKSLIESLRSSITLVGSAFKGFSEGVVQGFREIQAESAKTNETVNRTKREVEGAAGSARAMDSALKGMVRSFIAAFSIRAAVQWAKGMADAAEAMDQVSQRTGLSRQEVAQWNAVAKTANIESSQFANSVQRLNRNLVMAASGGKAQSAAFKALGIDAAAARGPQEVLLQIADRFKDMPDGPKKTALAMQLMGRTGAQLIPILNGGADALREQIEQATRLGAVFGETEEAQQAFLDKGLALDEAMDNFGLGMQGVSNALFDALEPAIQAIVESLTDMAARFVDSYRRGGEARVMAEALAGALKGLALVVIYLGLGLDVLIRTLLALGEAIGTAAFLIADVLVGAIRMAVGAMETYSRVMQDILRGDFAGAVRDAATGFRYIATSFKGMTADLARDAKAGGKLVAGQFNAGVRDAQLANQYAGNILKGGSAKPSKRKPAAAGDPDNEIEGLGGGGDKSKKGPGLLEQWRADLADMLAAEENWAADEQQLTLQFWQSKLSQVAAGSKEEVAIRREVARAKLAIHNSEMREEMAAIKSRTNLALAAAKGDVDVAKAGLQGELDVIAQRERVGEISAASAERRRAQVNARLRALDQEEADREYQLHLQELQAELALEGLKPDARAAINRQIEELEAQHQQRMGVLAAQAARQGAADLDRVRQVQESKAHGWVDPMVQAFGSGMNQMAHLSQGWLGFWQGMIDAAANTFEAWCEKQVQQWIVTHILKRGVSAASATADVATTATAEAAKTGAVAAGTASRLAVETAGAATSKSITLATALTDIGAAAARGAANTYAAIAAIPVVGPFLAPAMAVGALAAILGFAGKMFSAKGGWGQVPADGMVTELHKDEMVLPAKFATPLRGALQGGFSLPGGSPLTQGASAAGAGFREALTNVRGGDTFNYQPAVAAGPGTDQRGLKKTLRREGKTLQEWHANIKRNTPGEKPRRFGRSE